MVRKATDVNQGDLFIDKEGVHGPKCPEEPDEQESERS
jgi:hypothetical protein